MSSAAAAAAAAAYYAVRVRASWDTNPAPKPLTLPKTSPKPPPRLPPCPPRPRSPPLPPHREPLSWRETRTKDDGKYLGYERWRLPAAPKVKKPRSIYNAASLAYLGDCIYELYARRHFLFPPLSINEYNERVMKVVCCEAQDVLLKKLLAEDYLTEEERDILRWGKNITTSKSRTTKRAGVAIYNRASSLETLIGYLYLTNVERLEQLMFQLGFSTGASSHHIAEELRANLRKRTGNSTNSQQPPMQ
ncbi:Mini-ribonuclease 3 [Ananas comosus]|uniref:Mini-ribonuclease 3 n=1 Tax=Ananas comosus TaxID=4615 RepID=A0A199W8C8_ANACO|nr:Mini-ribonuclease 3 [Ananas comosus]